VQNEYSLIHREPENGVLGECAGLGIGFVPYFPLASGLLTGKYRAGEPPPEGSRIDATGRFSNLLNERNLELVDRLSAFAEHRGHTLLELAFSWLASRPAVASVIAGATNAEQVRANAAAAEWPLTESDRAEVDAILKRGAGASRSRTP